MFFATLIVPAFGCSDDDEEDDFACCQVQKICSNCSCDTSGDEIAAKGNKQACEAFLNDGSRGCGLYSESDAIADCS